MDRNTVTGLLMMVGLLVAYYFIFTPSSEEIERERQLQDSLKQAQKEIKVVPDDTTMVAETQEPDSSVALEPDSAVVEYQNRQKVEKYGMFASSINEDEGEEVILENNNIKATLSTKGGMFEEVVLKHYRDYWDSTLVSLWDPSKSDMAIAFDYLGKGRFSTGDFTFEPNVQKVVADSDEASTLTMTLRTDDPSKYIEFVYSLTKDAYDIDASINFVNMDGIVNTSSQTTMFNWDAVGYHNEKGITTEKQRSSVFYRVADDDRDYLSENSDDSEELEEPLNWMVFKQNFFSAGIIKDDNFPAGAKIASRPVAEEDSTHNTIYSAQIPLDVKPGSASSLPVKFYFGPNDFKELDALNVTEFDKIIDYGWGIFGWLNKWFVRPVFNFLSGFIGNYGIVILLITIFIKMLLFPITWKNYLSSAKMRVLKPEIDEINKKYEGKDAMEKQQATMGLYRKTGVNPMAGCLPMLLQMPILYAMFRFFPATIELRQERFLWADDLVNYDSILDLGFNIPLYGAHVSGFTLLMAASTFFYTRMNSSNMPTQSQPGMPNMKVIMNIFPFMMLFFFNSFAAGLSFYYFAANVISIGQMYVIKEYIIDEDKIRAKIESNKKKPKKKSSFQQRLEEMQKTQQQKGKKKK
ncbi:membrane protein insertase YidC [Halocola ammonii]